MKKKNIQFLFCAAQLSDHKIRRVTALGKYIINHFHVIEMISNAPLFPSNSDQKKEYKLFSNRETIAKLCTYSVLKKKLIK